MKINSILITGDDGYNSLGIRVLINLLKDKYDLVISATKKQQSGVGGKLTLSQKWMDWEETTIDGVKVLCVDGTPVDAIEFAQGYCNKKFDLVISGINWGPNLSKAIISSGTVCSALRSLANKLTDHSLALSWSVPHEKWNFDHETENDFKEYLDHPGQAASDMIDLCIQNDFFGVPFININFPQEKTQEYRFTTLCPDTKRVYAYPILIDHQNKTFNYPAGYAKEKEMNEKMDIGAIHQGFISISLIEETFKIKNVKL